MKTILGAVPYLYEKLSNVPIYTTSFTASVLKENFYLMVFNLLKLIFWIIIKNFIYGSFKIQIFALTHSIPEPNAIILKTQKGKYFSYWRLEN